jgi:hypothetical protein
VTVKLRGIHLDQAGKFIDGIHRGHVPGASSTGVSE